TAWTADMSPNSVRIETAAERYVEVRIQRPHHRLQVDVGAGVAGKVHRHAAVHRRELQPAVAFYPIEPSPHVAVHVGAVHSAGATIDVDLAVDGSCLDISRRTVDDHVAVDRGDSHLHAAWK